jgi:hypothetical protein
MSEISPMDKIKELQEQYYSNNKKNVFFKNKQKLDCASLVCGNIPIETLIRNTIYIVPETNKVCVDYTIFKLFATPENFQQIADYIIGLFQYCIQTHDQFQLHINLESFTISALERYKTIIRYFCDICMASDTRYSKKMEKMFIYHPPKSFNSVVSILKPLIDPSIYDKFILCDNASDYQFPSLEN